MGPVTAAGAIAVLQAALDTLGGVQLDTTGALPLVADSMAGASGSARAALGGLTGLVRTLAREHLAQHFGALDVDRLTPPASHADGARLSLLPVGTMPRCDVYGAAQRGGVHSRAAMLHADVISSAPAFHLMPRPRGALSSLKPELVAATPVAPGRVLVAVKAVGINFRDVLNVLGMYPGDPGPPGGDCAGVVVASGPGVSHLRPGDAVFGLAGGSLGSHVHVSSQTVTHVSAAPASQFCSGIGTGCGLRHVPCLNALQMPANLDFEAAATTPTVCITVDSAFRQSAVVRPGDRVLVHAAAGGVGIAAMQLIAALGRQHGGDGGQQQQACTGALAGSQPSAWLSRHRVCQRAGRGGRR